MENLKNPELPCKTIAKAIFSRLGQQTRLATLTIATAVMLTLPGIALNSPQASAQTNNQDLALKRALCDRQWNQAAQIAQTRANSISDPQLKQQWLDYRDRLNAVANGTLTFNAAEFEQLGCNQKYNLAGTVVFEKLQANVPSNLVVQPGRQCVVVSGHIDVKEGAPVVIKDGEGNTLITTKLGRGSTMPEQYSYANSQMVSPVQSINCLFAFNISDLPAADNYVIQVGNRAPQSFSRTLIEQNSWQVEVRVKNPPYITNGGLIY
jgi:hypothetical protein